MNECIKLRIAITQACNLFCQGCFNEWQSARSVKYAVVEDLVRNVKINFNNIHSIKLTGGEPFLHKDIGVIATMLLEIAPVSVTTNGLLLEKRVIDIPQSVPITISCYGVTEDEFSTYTQTRRKVYKRFIKQLQIVAEDADREYSLNVIIGDSKEWNLHEYINFSVKYGFKKIRFLTQLDVNSTQLSYRENYNSLIDYMKTLGVSYPKDGDPSRLYSHTDKILVELIIQYSDFNKETQNKRDQWGQFSLCCIRLRTMRSTVAKCSPR